MLILLLSTHYKQTCRLSRFLCENFPAKLSVIPQYDFIKLVMLNRYSLKLCYGNDFKGSVLKKGMKYPRHPLVSKQNRQPHNS